VRKTYRAHSSKDYWTSRWQNIPVDLPQNNIEAYPLKYALEAVGGKNERILEAGCGNGRILRFFKERDYDIEGFDYIDGAVHTLLNSDPELKVRTDDITKLSYDSDFFDCVLAFGLYHNLEEEGFQKAIQETNRVMKCGGRLCASFRADNFQNLINDSIAQKTFRGRSKSELKFHKLNLRAGELTQAFEKGGFTVEQIRPVENMPLLYKSRFFRAKGHKRFDESLGRREGYLLSPLGNLLQKLLIGLFPHQFCNIYVLNAEKK
jgi:SAM-dependent methyltransferase